MRLGSTSRILLNCGLALLLALGGWLFFSPRLRHTVRRVSIRTEMTLARWGGHPPELASLAGATGIPGAQVQALDSKSGWAALTNRNGKFLLLDVMWYPGARYDLVMSVDGVAGKMVSVTAPKELADNRVIELGNLPFEDGVAVDLSTLPGVTTVTYEPYDKTNASFYSELYGKIAAGKQSDAEIVSALNDYVASKLDYSQTQWELGSPRRILETGSQYCGHLTEAMATLLAAGGYRTRIIHLSDGQTPPATHAVGEVFYRDGWHLFDPTFGALYRNPDGSIASYRDLRLDPGLIKEECYWRFEPARQQEIAALVGRILRTGHHHFYRFKESS